MSDSVQTVLDTVSDIFAALRRILVCIDADFRVAHVSNGLPETLVGMPVADFLGEALFGPGGTLRQALEMGETREGWRASFEEVLYSVTVAPFRPRAPERCDPRVRYIALLRPALDEPLTDNSPMLFGGMIARSPSMVRLFELIEHLKSSEATVLLTGESGTGKELVARAVHDYSPRRRGPFVAVNCGVIPADLLEGELFGPDRVGRFELAAGGTLFLDEIGDMPLPLQVKLLHVLQETANVRIIAATHVDLRRAVAEGRFREDLYYRLRVVPMEIPPLRDRREDIEPLARSLLSRIAARHGRQVRFSPDAIRRLLQHTWPGNVRELENAIEYAVAVTGGQTIMPEDLPIESVAASHRVVNEAEEIEAIRAALDQNHWRRDAAARALNMSRTTLWRKMREYHLE